MEPVGPKQKIIFFFNKIRTVLVAIVVNYLLCSVLYAQLEDVSFSDARWWTSVTMFTVGYGDIFPSTEMGRAVGQYTMISFFFLSALLLALIIDAVRFNRDQFSHEEQEHQDSKTDRLVFVVDNLVSQLAERGIIDPVPDGDGEVDKKYLK